MIISENCHPPVGIMGGSVHSYERGVSPWHIDAFPDHLKMHAPEKGMRKNGWYALDWCGNEIGFYPDGMEWGGDMK